MKNLIPFVIILIFSCNNSNEPDISNPVQNSDFALMEDENVVQQNFLNGTDYIVYKRVRLIDKIGFTEPVEAYSALLPENWKHKNDIIWEPPGTPCMGTYRKFSAGDDKGNIKLELFPDHIYSWTSNELLRSLNSGNSSEFCSQQPPLDAEKYLSDIFLQEIGNPKIVKTENVPGVINEMKEKFNANLNELTGYGAGNVNFHPSAIKADVEWNDGKKGILTVSVGIAEITVPNQYTGGYDMIYTTQVSNKTMFVYSDEKSEAEKMYGVIMTGFRTNPFWQESVNNFWKQTRANKHIVHLGKIKAIDERTNQIAKDAIASGNRRLAEMDNQQRSWEQKQQLQDRMHTEFIKTIRGVENYQDATGKYEMSSGYNHAWSRNDGSSFILTDNPNFDPSSVFQDQNWKEMKKKF